MEGDNPAHGVDGITLVDAASGESMVFNHFTWLALIAAIIVKYAHKSDDEAAALIARHPVTARPVGSYAAVALLGHELEFHWATLIVHGDMYWRRGIDPALPLGHADWKKHYRRDHHLAAESFVWS